MAADVETHESQPSPARPAPARHRRELVFIAAVFVVLVVAGAWLVHRAHHKVNRVALAGTPRPVSVVEAAATTYSDNRTYVGAAESWIEASVGPQYISAYVTDVRVRPGDVVTRDQILATLDCAHPSASRRAVEMQAKAIGEQQKATADEAARQSAMLKGGFIAPNQVEQTTARSSAERARLMETQARGLAASLEVRDCTLRAPFDGEIALRTIDPGAFVHPGATIVSVVDRHIVRIVVDAPEKDFAVAHVGAPVRIEALSTGAKLTATVTRRAPKADPATRTIHFEIDVADPQRQIPTGTTAIVRMDVGTPVAATRIPLQAATQAEGKAKLFVVENEVAHLRRVPVMGERGGGLYFSPQALPPKTVVVTEGRALLSDGDRVAAQPEAPAPEAEGDGIARGGGFGRPL